MNAQGNIIVFGSLALMVIMIVVGVAFRSTPWGGGIMALGFLGLAAWVCFAIWLGIQMNTDI